MCIRDSATTAYVRTAVANIATQIKEETFVGGSTVTLSSDFAKQISGSTPSVFVNGLKLSNTEFSIASGVVAFTTLYAVDSDDTVVVSYLINP